MQTNYELIRIPSPVLFERAESSLAWSAVVRPSANRDLVLACRGVARAEAVETAVWVLVAVTSLAALGMSLWIT